MKKKSLIFVLIVFVSSLGLFFINSKNNPIIEGVTQTAENFDVGGIINSLHPLSIESLRKAETPGSDLIIEQTLNAGTNYKRYVASYKSDGLKIYGLLTIPNGEKPQTGWPVVVFNHGYIAPTEYRTTEKYVAYQDGFARNGYITFKSDYRGHGNSEGAAAGGYGSNSYTIDVLNALASLKRHSDVDGNRIGFWGHSMGGHITLRSMVANKDIRAGVIWAGVVASYDDLLNNWRRRSPSATPYPTSNPRSWRQALVDQFGEPSSNPEFWNSISANAYLANVTGPIQLHHGTADTSVPVLFSEKLDQQLKEQGKVSELYIYTGDDHNLTNNFNVAMQRSIEFFDKYVKDSK